MGLVTTGIPWAEKIKPYTEEDKAFIKKKYTPAQIKAIEAGEAFIKPRDLYMKGTVRSDMGALSYFDDFSQLQTVVDRKPAQETPNDPKARMTTEDEFGSAFVKWLEKIQALEPKGLTREDPDYAEKMRPNRADFFRMTHEINAVAGSKGLHDVLPLSQFKPRDKETDAQIAEKERVAEEMKALKEEEENDTRDPDGIYNLLRKQTGIDLDSILELKTKILVTHRVVNQTRLGKIDSMYCLAIAGNGKGRLGIGQAKGQELEGTQNLARIAAIKNLRPIPRYEERTIFGEVSGKVSASIVTLSSRPPGKILSPGYFDMSNKL